MENLKIQTKSDLPEKDRTRCFFCDGPLTSDDFKLDRIEEVKNFIAHRKCVDDAIAKEIMGMR